MKKVILILVGIVLAFSVDAQILTYEEFMKNAENIIVYKNKEKKKIDYQKTALSLAELYPLDKHNAISRSVVYNIPGKSANEIYIEVNNWFVHSFGSGKSVIQLNDKEEGCIIGKGFIDALGTNSGFFNISDAAAWIILRVDIKDEKIRVIATIQSYEVTKSTGIGAALMGVPVQKYGVVEYVPSECFPYTKKEKGTGSKAITLAHCWIVSCFEQLNDAVNHGITGLESDDF